MLGFDLGRAEDGAFWLESLRALLARGLTGTQLVISDGRSSMAAVHSALHEKRADHVPRMAQQMVAASIQTILCQPDQLRHDVSCRR